MSIEIKNLSIKSSVVQRQRADDDAAGDDAADGREAPTAEQWRTECRRVMRELLEARGER